MVLPQSTCLSPPPHTSSAALPGRRAFLTRGRGRRLHAVTRADPSLLLRNSQGDPVHLGVDGKNSGVYDVRNPKMRAAFVENALCVADCLLP